MWLHTYFMSIFVKIISSYSSGFFKKTCLLGSCSALHRITQHFQAVCFTTDPELHHGGRFKPAPVATVSLDLSPRATWSTNTSAIYNTLHTMFTLGLRGVFAQVHIFASKQESDIFSWNNPPQKMKSLEGLIRRTAQDFPQEVENLIPPPTNSLFALLSFPPRFFPPRSTFSLCSRPFMYRSEEAATYHRSGGRLFPMKAGITWLI